MRIISKFKDYYDKALSFGHDPNCIYKRETLDVTETEIDKEFGLKTSKQINYPNYIFIKNNIKLGCSPFRIAFCGKIYQGLSIQRLNLSTIERSIEHIGCFYDIFSLKEALVKHNALELIMSPTEAKFEMGEIKKQPKKSKENPFYHLPKLADTKNFLLAQATTDKFNYFVKKQVVIATSSFHPMNFNYYQNYYHEKKVEVDSCLMPFQFYKVMPPNMAFQELDMFISGVLPQNDKKMVEISNESKIIEHGFDDWSFRKPPTQKK